MSRVFDKYKVEKKDGTPVDANAQYFVLRIDTDPHARVALRAYARSVRATDPGFADDLDRYAESGVHPATAPAREAVEYKFSHKGVDFFVRFLTDRWMYEYIVRGVTHTAGGYMFERVAEGMARKSIDIALKSEPTQ